MFLPSLNFANEFAFCNHLDAVKGGFYTDFSKIILNSHDEVTMILVRKDLRRLYLLNKNQIVKSYNIALGRQVIGPKVFEGDFKTPEGIYLIDKKNSFSNYHKSLRISYPNFQDIARAHKMGRSPGGNVLIHGLSNNPIRKTELLAGKHPVINWTWGCIAVTDDEIDEIFSVIQTGTPIEICPLPENSPLKLGVSKS